MVYAQFEITLYFKQSGRRNATEPKAHAIERRDRRPSHECSPVPFSPVQLLPLPIQYPPCCPPSFFARARTNNVSAIFERYHDSHRPGLLRVEPWGNNVVGSRNPGQQVQVAVCACVVGEGRGEELQHLWHLRAALRTFAFCIRHEISRIYVSITKQLETPTTWKAKALDDLTLIYEWEGSRVGG